MNEIGAPVGMMVGTNFLSGLWYSKAEKVSLATGSLLLFGVYLENMKVSTLEKSPLVTLFILEFPPKTAEC